MGKLDVTVLRYLTKDDFRILTAVNSDIIIMSIRIYYKYFNKMNNFRLKC